MSALYLRELLNIWRVGQSARILPILVRKETRKFRRQELGHKKFGNKCSSRGLPRTGPWLGGVNHVFQFYGCISIVLFLTDWNNNWQNLCLRPWVGGWKYLDHIYPLALECLLGPIFWKCWSMLRQFSFEKRGCVHDHSPWSPALSPSGSPAVTETNCGHGVLN